MQIHIPLPSLDFVQANPWTTAGVALAVWYAVANIVIRVKFRGERDLDERFRMGWMWLLSPLTLPLAVTVGSLWVVLWVVSLGLFPAPWSKEV